MRQVARRVAACRKQRSGSGLNSTFLWSLFKPHTFFTHQNLVLPFESGSTRSRADLRTNITEQLTGRSRTFHVQPTSRSRRTSSWVQISRHRSLHTFGDLWLTKRFHWPHTLQALHRLQTSSSCRICSETSGGRAVSKSMMASNLVEEQNTKKPGDQSRTSCTNRKMCHMLMYSVLQLLVPSRRSQGRTTTAVKNNHSHTCIL